MPRRGYWGDIANSPYIAYGVVCDEPEMLKKAQMGFQKVHISSKFAYRTASKEHLSILECDSVIVESYIDVSCCSSRSKQTSAEVSAHNVTALLHELTTGTPYVLPTVDAPTVTTTAQSGLTAITEEDETAESKKVRIVFLELTIELNLIVSQLDCIDSNISSRMHQPTQWLVQCRQHL